MKAFPDLLKYIDPTKLPWDYQELIDIVGLEKTLEIAARCGGTHVYLEKLDTILMPAKRAYVLARFSGENEEPFHVRQVARDINLSQETVYEMLRKRNRKDGEDDGWKQEELI